jgi:acyl carrier protein
MDDQPLFSESEGVDSLGLDSLDAVELSLALETKFDLGDAPGDLDLRQLGTVDDIVEFVVKLLPREPVVALEGAGGAGE